MEGFEALLRLYRQALPEKRELLERAWHGVQHDPAPEPHAQALRRHLHNLSGSGGAYGFDELGDLARQLEKPWKQWLALPAPRPDPAALCAEHAAAWRALIDLLIANSLPPDLDEPEDRG